MDSLSTLTSKQADAVKKRVDTLRATQSKKQRQKTDIRQIDFNNKVSSSFLLFSVIQLDIRNS